MVKSSAAKQAIFRQPHPLAQALLATCAPGSRVLEIGPGSGRNLAALLPSMDVAAVEADLQCATQLRKRFPQVAHRIVSGSYERLPFAGDSFDGALSTHALLHGTPRDIRVALAELHRVCKAGGRLFATFGSQRDRRFGEGRRITARCFAPVRGDERGIAHSFFAGSSIRKLLHGFEIERLSEIEVDSIAGSWAHRDRPLTGAAHWFAVLRKPQPPAQPLDRSEERIAKCSGAQSRSHRAPQTEVASWVCVAMRSCTGLEALA